MLTIPTDSLNKFLAIGSIISMVFLMDICLKNYEKAELAYISAFIKGSEFQEKYKKYSSHVNKGIEAYNNSVKNKVTLSKTEQEKVLAEMDEASLMEPQMEKMSYEVLEVSHNAMLYSRLKYIWIGITFLALVICLFAAFIGFRGWYLSEKNTIN